MLARRTPEHCDMASDRWSRPALQRLQFRNVSCKDAARARRLTYGIEQVYVRCVRVGGTGLRGFFGRWRVFWRGTGQDMLESVELSTVRIGCLKRPRVHKRNANSRLWVRRRRTRTCRTDGSRLRKRSTTAPARRAVSETHTHRTRRLESGSFHFFICLKFFHFFIFHFSFFEKFDSEKK